MTNWFEIWQKKGESQCYDLRKLDGFENTDINEQQVAANIIALLDIKENEKVLDVGCGAGMIAQFLNCDYTGVDYSESMLSKHKNLLHNKLVHCQANQLPFEDHFFDKVFAFSVFQYFPDKHYSQQVIKEMIRISRKNVFIGDLPFTSHSKDHLLFVPEEFSDWIISDGFYNSDRFNALHTF